MDFKYFNYSEFDSPDLPDSGKKFMDPKFIQTLDKIREEVGIPFFINSGYRTPEWNRKVNGVSNSAHIRGRAADIRTPSGFKQKEIAKAAVKHGITRIGFGTNFIHLDNDTTLPYPRTWGYGGKKPLYSYSELINIA